MRRKWKSILLAFRVSTFAHYLCALGSTSFALPTLLHAELSSFQHGNKRAFCVTFCATQNLYSHNHDKIPSIVAIPAVLYFPHAVVEQLNELCTARQLTPQELMAEVLKSQRPRFDRFIEDVMTTRKPGEPPTWPEDPLYCLACGTMRHFARNFLTLEEDPAAFQQMRKDAPAEWSFGSIEELNDDDPADWWKTGESE